MNFFRALWRTILLVLMFAEAGTELLWRRPATRLERADWLHRFCARALRRLEVEVSVSGGSPDHGAVITNHLSYLDIVVLASIRPCVFVSKAEVRGLPVVGWMTTMSGTVYVERGHGGSALRARSGVQDAVDAGLPVVFFPEGTTSNGEGLLKFHSGLLSQVLAVGADVTAGFIRYGLGPGNKPDVTVAEDVCWGDRNMWLHIFKLLGLRGLRAEVRFAERPIAFVSSAAQRKQAALEARAAVQELLEAGRMKMV